MEKESEMKTLTSIAEIKRAVDDGKDVYCNNESYRVMKDRIGQYLIVRSINNHCIGLHGMEGTKYENQLNGTNFFIKS